MGQRRVNRMARLLEDQRWGGIRTTAAVIKLRESSRRADARRRVAARSRLAIPVTIRVLRQIDGTR